MGLQTMQPVTAQEVASSEVVDKIVAVIGKSRIILQSDIEAQYNAAKQQDPNLHDSVKCVMLLDMVMQKLLVEQAERDSLLVPDEDVEGALENRIRYYTRQFGSVEKLEEISGKTIFQLKDENREVIKEQMMAERMRSKILSNIKITPAEVKAFYDQVPVDSLPFYPAHVELGQIVIDPEVSPEMDEYARKKLEDIRNQIVNEGKSFEVMAGIYSEDPGSRDNGGRYNDVTRDGGFVKEFVANAFKLQNGEISPVFRTTFGYHIIQMIQRKGEKVDLRHILVRPQRTSSDYEAALLKLDSIRIVLLTEKMSFSEAVGKFSTDEMAKQTGGMIINPETGSSELDIADLDPTMVMLLDTLKPGNYSAPQLYVNERGEQSTRIIYLKTRSEPHKANLRDDYSKIQQVALNRKQGLHLEQWLLRRINEYYIKIDPEYQKCHVLEQWGIKSAQP
jgi:peptidyl-prolyl cis-trans isomerase SurA